MHKITNSSREKDRAFRVILFSMTAGQKELHHHLKISIIPFIRDGVVMLTMSRKRRILSSPDRTCHQALSEVL